MFLISQHELNNIQIKYGSITDSTCFAINKISHTQSVLLLNDTTIKIVNIYRVTNSVTGTITCPVKQLSNVLLKNNFLDVDFQFVFKSETYKFSIMKKIVPMGNLQGYFLSELQRIAFHLPATDFKEEATEE